MTLPIIDGSQHQKPRELFCVGCGKTVQEAAHGLVCLNDKCQRFGLISIAAKDPSLEGKTMEDLDNPKKVGGESGIIVKG